MKDLIVLVLSVVEMGFVCLLVFQFKNFKLFFLQLHLDSVELTVRLPKYDGPEQHEVLEVQSAVYLLLPCLLLLDCFFQSGLGGLALLRLFGASP
jgi:hypothetical protein